MLSIKQIQAGHAKYYASLSADDYYSSESKGHWLGSGAAALGFSGIVTAAALLNAFAGRSADGLRQLVQSHKNRRPGYDLTFSDPKEVAILWALGHSSLACAIIQARRNALNTTIRTIESDFLTARMGRGGAQKVAVNILGAAYEHVVSRESDPQLHTHFLLINLGVRPDGSTGSIEAKKVVEAKLLLGRIYQDALAAELERSLGLRFERRGNILVMPGFPARLKDAFSKRRRQIVDELRRRGVDGGKAASVAALATRKSKVHRALSEQRREWQAEAQRLGFEPSRLFADVLAAQRTQQSVDPLTVLENRVMAKGRTSNPQPVPVVPSKRSSSPRHTNHPTVAPTSPPPRQLPAALPTKPTGEIQPGRFARYMARRAIREAARQSSHFSFREILEHSVHDKWCRIYNLDKLIDALPFELDRWRQVVKLGTHQSATRYTTKEVLRIERKLIKLVNDGQRSSWHVCRVGSVLAAPLMRRSLSAEQQLAVKELTMSPKAIAVLEGAAGSGKTTTLCEAAKIWKASGYTIRGAAITGKAAKELESASGIQSDTITRTIWDAQRGRIRFHPWSLVVVDEAAMADTRQLYELSRRVRRGGGKLVLVGDPRQLQPVISGNAFGRILQSIRGARLTTTVRQRHAWLRDAVADFAAGRAVQALQQFSRRGLLISDASRDHVIQRLVVDWRNLSRTAPKDRIILCGTKEDARDVNRAIQFDKSERGLLGRMSIKLGDCRLHRGDRVIFTRNHRKLGVRNGDIGKVLAVIPPLQHLLVKLDNGSYRFVPTLVYRHLQLGEAITTHRGQGMTVQRAQIFISGGRLSREMTYVQASRARESTSFYVDPKRLPHLAKNMSRSDRKTLAIDLQDRPQRRKREQELTP